MHAYIKGHRTSNASRPLRRSSSLSAGPRKPVTIVIPVYRGLDVTGDCIESVLQSRPDTPANRLVIVNDCSPEPAMRDMLQSFAREPRVVLLTNDRNLGFIQSVNRAIRAFPGGDIVLLNSDTRVFAGWLEDLVEAAYSAPSIGTVTPLSNNATIFSYPHPSFAGQEIADVTWEELATVARLENFGKVIDVPTGHGFCLYIKSDILDQVGCLDEKYGRGYGEENDLCCRAADLGYRHVAAGNVFVEHRESISFGPERATLWERNRPLLEAAFPEYTPQIMTYERHDDLRRARWALDAYRLKKASREIATGFCLVVKNWLGGGSDTAILDLRNSIGKETEIVLTAQENGYVSVAVEHPKIYAVFAPGEEYELFSLIGLANIRLVVCHQLLGFSEAFVNKFSEWVADRPSALYLHDFYPFCPRVNLIDTTHRFCNLPDVAVCERCVKTGGAHEADRLELSVDDHRRMFSNICKNFKKIITPSENTATYFRQVFPDLVISVHPHPQTLWTFPDKVREGDPKNIILLGAIGPHKGSQTLLEIAGRATLTHPHLRFHVVGYTNIDRELLALGNVWITGKYDATELPELVLRIDACIALFLHGWPETFSYALTEAVALGLIPLVPDIGAPADRVRQSGFGLVYPYPIDSARVLSLLASIGNGDLRRAVNGVGPASFRSAPPSINLTDADRGSSATCPPAGPNSGRTLRPASRRSAQRRRTAAALQK